MELVDFLIERCAEELAAVSCTYEACEAGVRCLCERPDGQRLELLARLELVRRWGGRSDPVHALLLRTLAQEHRDDPRFLDAWVEPHTLFMPSMPSVVPARTDA